MTSHVGRLVLLRGRPRLSYREDHRNAPVELAAAQAGPWHRPANYRPLQLHAAPEREDLARGQTRGPKEDKQIRVGEQSSPSKKNN